MTPIINIRSFTDDQYWLDKVFYTNSYKLRGFKINEKRPIVVDIGAHCGYFAFTALSIGAEKVYCVEPFIENYKTLLKNLGDNSAVISHNIAITNNIGFTCFEYPLPEKGTLLFGFPGNCNDNSFKKCVVSTCTLDNYISNIVNSQIDILKINIGGQEKDILLSSNLDSIQSICGETIIESEHIAEFKAKMFGKGFIKSHISYSKEEQNKISFIFSKVDIESYYSL